MATVPPEDQLKVAQQVKEGWSYVCQDIVKEFRKYDVDPAKYFARYKGEHSVTGRVSRLTCSLKFISDGVIFRNMNSISVSSVS